MKDVRDNIFSFLDDWYGRLDDIIEDLKEHDFDVLNATNEWIDVSKDDKEYVLKLGGTERTITINSIESLNESTKSLTEGGIYPVGLYGGAKEAFIKAINEILGGNVSEVDDLELIPSLGFGGAGRYWYKASITLDEDTIVNYISSESTPEAKRLLDSGKLVINSYSDISVNCSANIAQYQDGVTLDALNDSDADMKTLDNESNVIGEAIIAELVQAEEKILKILKDYEESPEYDEDEELDESLIPIREVNEVEPKLGKRVKQFRGWKIYKGTSSYGDEVFRCFTPDETRPEVGYEDWETETLEQAISWINNYNLEESKKTNKEDLSNVSEGDSSDSNDGQIVIERKTFGNYEENVFTALDNMAAYIEAYEEVNNDTLKALIDNLEDELEVLKDIDMKMLTGIKQYTL